MIDDGAIAAIRSRLSAIEQGAADWKAEDALDTSSIEAEREGRIVWYVASGETDDSVPVFVADNVIDRATAEFIAAAPNDMRTLLDLVNSLRRQP